MATRRGETPERDLRVITVHRVLRRTPFWMPVFFLYFTERFSVAAALALGGLYYLVVFVTEVPSGYASDRLGRVPLLRLSAGLEVVAMSLFVIGGAQIGAFVAAQVCIPLLRLRVGHRPDTALRHACLGGPRRGVRRTGGPLGPPDPSAWLPRGPAARA